jgi:hypothetical protein
MAFVVVSSCNKALFSQACSIIVCNEFICDNFKQRYVFKAKNKTQINLKMLQKSWILSSGGYFK